jgi:hypothetical protein
MRLKAGVHIIGLKSEALLAIMIAESVFQDTGHDCVLTSVTEGVHETGSIHFQGLAFDLRTRDLGASLKTVLAELQDRLGPDFEVITEKDHAHVEYNPRTAS